MTISQMMGKDREVEDKDKKAVQDEVAALSKQLMELKMTMESQKQVQEEQPLVIESVQDSEAPELREASVDSKQKATSKASSKQTAGSGKSVDADGSRSRSPKERTPITAMMGRDNKQKADQNKNNLNEEAGGTKEEQAPPAAATGKQVRIGKPATVSVEPKRKQRSPGNAPTKGNKSMLELMGRR